MKSLIPWVGGKSKLLWLIHKLAPPRYSKFIDVFGGSGTVTLNHPIRRGCVEIYNDFNGDLTNLFFCVKDQPMALVSELGYLPLNARDDFNVLYKFFSGEEFTDDYLKQELELTEKYLPPPEAETIRRLMSERASRGDVRRAADYFKLVRYSFSGGARSFAGRPCDLRRFFYLIWECSRRLADVVIENRDCVDLIRQNDQEDTFFYCDPPYYDAEDCYAVGFPKEDHQRLHDALAGCSGYVMEQSGLVPNKGFRMLQHHKDKRLPEDADFFCVVCYDEGGGVRVDVFFDTYEQGTLTSERFAVGRDSGSTTTDLDRMFHIAAELTKAICGDGIAECRPVRERPRVRKIPRPAGDKQ